MLMRSLLIGLFLIVLNACEDQKPEVIYKSVNNTISAEGNTETYEDWLNSDYHPERVFDEWLEWQAESATVCNELLKLSALDLTVFENQIRDPKYKKIIISCQRVLINKLDDYWKKERGSFPAPRGDYKVSSQTIYLDQFPREKLLAQFLKPKQVLLTFDDGPHPEYTEKLLKILRQAQAKALFFMLGKNMERLPDQVFKIASQAHAIGTHTHNHKCIAQNRRCRMYNNHPLSQGQSFNEIDQGVNSVLKILGWTHPFFRFPYGEASRDLQNHIYDKGFFDFYWTIDSEDWKKRSLSEYYSLLITQVDQKRGGNILFHDIQKRTIEVMGPFLKYLHKNDYTIVVVKAKPITNF